MTTAIAPLTGHDALHAAIEDARQQCDQLWQRVLTASTDAYTETMEAWTLCNVRHSALIEAGMIYTNGREDRT